MEDSANPERTQRAYTLRLTLTPVNTSSLTVVYTMGSGVWRPLGHGIKLISNSDFERVIGTYTCDSVPRV